MSRPLRGNSMKVSSLDLTNKIKFCEHCFFQPGVGSPSEPFHVKAENSGQTPVYYGEHYHLCPVCQRVLSSVQECHSQSLQCALHCTAMRCFSGGLKKSLALKFISFHFEKVYVYAGDIF